MAGSKKDFVQMNSELISVSARATHEGTKPFPEIVGMLLEAGVEYYHVDYAGMQTRFYGANGDQVCCPILFEGLPPIAPELDVAEVKAAIFDSQRNGQKHREFTRRAMAAGVQGYYSFLRGKRVSYFGRQGDQHTEWFPGAEPQGT